MLKLILAVLTNDAVLKAAAELLSHRKKALKQHAKALQLEEQHTNAVALRTLAKSDYFTTKAKFESDLNSFPF